MAAIVSTHTTRHLRLTLLGLSLQSHRPNYLVVSCDNDAPEIAQALIGAALLSLLVYPTAARALLARSRPQSFPTSPNQEIR